MLRQNCILVCYKTTQNNQCKLVMHSSSHRKTARHVKVVWNLTPESMVKEKKTKTQDIWLCKCTGRLEGKVHGSESHNIMLGPGNRPSGCIGSHQGCSLATFCKLGGERAENGQHSMWVYNAVLAVRDQHSYVCPGECIG